MPLKIENIHYSLASGVGGDIGTVLWDPGNAEAKIHFCIVLEHNLMGFEFHKKAD